MRRQWSALVVLAGSLVFLASLYLPWRDSSCPSSQFGASSFLCGTVDGLSGWYLNGNGVGRAAALVALLLAVCSAVRIASKSTSDPPVGFLAGLTGYLAIAVASQTRTQPYSVPGAKTAIHFHFAYGAYLGLAAALVVVIAMLAPQRRAILAHCSAGHLAGLVLVTALLVTFLVPWWHLNDFGGYSWRALGIADPAATVAAAFAVGLPIAWWRGRAAARVRAVLLAAAGLLFTVGAASPFRSSPTTAAWVAIAVAVTLVGLTAIELRGAHDLARLRWPAAAVAGAGALVATGLFLPWRYAHYGVDKSLGPYSGRTVTTNGWTDAGVVAAVLAIALAATVLAPRRRRLSRFELVLGLALFIATSLIYLLAGRRFLVEYELGYGAVVSIVGATLLAVLALANVSSKPPDLRRVRARIVPIVLCLVYLGAVVQFWWWEVFPAGGYSLIIAPFSWLTIAGALLGIHLLGSWVRRIVDPTADADRLVLLPLCLFALAAIDLVAERNTRIMTRGGSIVVALCLALAFFGYAERRGGIRNLRIPEILRVDRIE